MSIRNKNADGSEVIASEISRLVFLYANAGGPCSLCDRRRHLLAACCFEVHVGSRRQVYNGVELCPACLARAGEGAGLLVMRKQRREMVASLQGATTPLDRQNLRDAQEYGDQLVALAERGRCRFPPLLPSRWIARVK
jgi:hypothetical protein